MEQKSGRECNFFDGGMIGRWKTRDERNWKRKRERQGENTKRHRKKEKILALSLIFQ